MPYVNEHPDRLTIEEYMASTSYCLLKQQLNSPVPLHWHEFYELSFITGGHGINTVNGLKIPIEPGTLFLLTPADFHEIRPLTGSTLTLYNFIFRESLIETDLRNTLFRDSRCIHLSEEKDSARAAAFFQILDDESQIGDAVGERMVQNMLECLLLLLCRYGKNRQEETEATLSSHRLGIQQALLYLQLHFREALTLQEVAREFGLSPNYFSECFRKHTGITFQQFLLDTRLEFAQSLLQASALPISEVCYSSGFNTLNHFEKMYKRKYGYPPNQNRKR
ncbi:AraC family transcriptional regulator [Paenibacillus sp. XY044]|uniref:AraC family transcriptional regulator n=1 Tax=Paenibacillus sp. XY044 TaxID=2026089 RepID=UPI0015C64379|nr:AraC family transcriptional regulator [Paenibacillus sp. XY044]